MKTIGTITEYLGTEHSYLKGYPVKIIAVLKNTLDEDGEIDEDAYDSIDNDEDLQRAGGVTLNDRIEVTPWIEKAGRYSFATSDPRAQDLACFKNLKR